MKKIGHIIIICLLIVIGVFQAIAGTVVFKRGTSSNIPSSFQTGEPAFTTDTNQLFIGTGSSKVEFLGAARYTNFSSHHATSSGSGVVAGGHYRFGNLSTNIVSSTGGFNVDRGTTGQAISLLDATTHSATIVVPNTLTTDPTLLITDTGLLFNGSPINSNSSWGSITGTLSSQTDLWTQFQAYELQSAHNSDINTLQSSLTSLQTRFNNLSTSVNNLRAAISSAGVDTTPPVLTRNSPAFTNNSSNTNSFVLNYTTSDPQGLAASHPLKYSIDGGTTVDMTSGSNSTLTGFAANVESTILVTATNAVNMTTTDTTTFKYKTSACTSGSVNVDNFTGVTNDALAPVAHDGSKGQSFQVANDGTIRSILVSLTPGAGSGNVTLRWGTNIDLTTYTDEVTIALSGADVFTLHEFVLPSHTVVTTGTTYYFGVMGAMDYSGTPYIGRSSTSTYANGHAYYGGFDLWSYWVDDSPKDVIFQVKLCN
jgi:hypothetical protein